MIDRPDDSSDSHPPETEAEHSGLVPQLGMIVRALLASPVARSLVALIAGVFAVIVATAYGQVWLNRWNQPFYDALTRRDFRDFIVQLGVFFIIVGCSPRAQRGAALAGRDVEGEAARGADAGTSSATG